MSETLKESAVRIETVLRHQAAMAAFGSFAFRETDLPTILDKAVRICANAVIVPFCKVYRYRSKENDLLMEAGCGWQLGLIGRVVERADESSPQGRAYITGNPVIIRNLQEANNWVLSALYRQNEIISTIDVVIKGFEGPAYGVLEIDSPTEHACTEDDVRFLCAFANVLGEAVATHTRVAALTTVIDEKGLLAREMNHRVRNNLHLIQALLDTYATTLSGDQGKQDIESIALRLMTMAQMYDHLLGSGLNHKIDFGVYTNVLCTHIAAIQRREHDNVSLTCTTEYIPLDLDMVTTLGLVVAEVVTNCYVHAFPNGRSGAISVSLSEVDASGKARIIIKDNGMGFVARTDTKRHGLGLVTRLVEQVGGSIDLRSDSGTTWTLSFATGVST